MRVVALIPARGGSKGVPRKNVRPIAGKPLIAWTIEAARACTRLADVVVTTDDEEIAEVARTSGASVPFLRPAELATDTSPAIDAVLHALDGLPPCDALVLLQPTSPLRSTADIDAVLDLAVGGEAATVVSVCAAHDHPDWMYTVAATGGMLEPLRGARPATRRQDLAPVVSLNGAVYFARTDWLRRERSFVGTGTLAYTMPAERSVDIDGLLDWKLAELLLRERNQCVSP